ncbi:HlyD family secretion protein [Sphingobacterium spiritivorum]|uniref:HlyD family secretion protein n=1 Tax=Sphingobacterium spiritivorum TaxID=258 RepID=UPI003DA26856
MSKQRYESSDLHSEDMQDIIAKPPSWLLQRGISFIFLTLTMLFGMTAFVRYPQTISSSMKITTDNAPKPVVNKLAGSIVRLLVKDGQKVTQSEVLGYMESTGNHDQILNLLEKLKKVQQSIDNYNVELRDITSPVDMELGEIQSSYQNFYQSYLNYQAVRDEGAYIRKRSILLKEMNNIGEQNKRIQDSYTLQKREIDLAEREFEKYKILAEKRVISPMELQKQEALLISKKQAIPLAENNLLNNHSASLARIKELSDLENQISDEKKKFYQSLNSLISEIENWKKQYVLVSPASGYVIYGSSIQENQFLPAATDVFYINSKNETYYGEMQLPQLEFGKIKIGQEVMIKVLGFQYQEYGYLKGRIQSISDIPIKDSLFLSKVSIERTPKDSLIRLRPRLLADVEIITEEQSILKRIWRNLTKNFYKY